MFENVPAKKMFNNLLVATVQGCTGYVTRCKSDAKLAVRLSTPCFLPNIGNTTILVSQQYCIPIILILQQYYCSSNLDIWIWYEQIFISGNIPIYISTNIGIYLNIKIFAAPYCATVLLYNVSKKIHAVCLHLTKLKTRPEQRVSQ